jgi:hypothetical protein
VTADPLLLVLRRGRRRAAYRVRDIGRYDGASGAAVRAVHRQLQLRPPRGRLNRVNRPSLVQILSLLIVLPTCMTCVKMAKAK